MAVSRSRPTRTSESLVDFAESCACEKPRQPARLCEPALERLHRLCRYRRARFSQPREYFAPRKTELGSVLYISATPAVTPGIAGGGGEFVLITRRGIAIASGTKSCQCSASTQPSYAPV